MDNPEKRPAPGHAEYKVVVNHEEQYALWPVGKQIPEKWRDTGIIGSRQECLACVRKVWTDMRPLSIRNRTRARVSGKGSNMGE